MTRELESNFKTTPTFDIDSYKYYNPDGSFNWLSYEKDTNSLKTLNGEDMKTLSHQFKLFIVFFSLFNVIFVLSSLFLMDMT